MTATGFIVAFVFAVAIVLHLAAGLVLLRRAIRAFLNRIPDEER